MGCGSSIPSVCKARGSEEKNGWYCKQYFGFTLGSKGNSRIEAPVDHWDITTPKWKSLFFTPHATYCCSERMSRFNRRSLPGAEGPPPPGAFTTTNYHCAADPYL